MILTLNEVKQSLAESYYEWWDDEDNVMTKQQLIEINDETRAELSWVSYQGNMMLKLTSVQLIAFMVWKFILTEMTLGFKNRFQKFQTPSGRLTICFDTSPRNTSE